MSKVSDALTVETERNDDGSYCFVVVADQAGVAARSTSTYSSQGDAIDAGGRLTTNLRVDAEVVPSDGGWVIRLHGGNLEALTDPWPERQQAEWVLIDLTG